MLPQNQVLALNGCDFVDSAAGAITGKDWCYLVVNADAVLSVLSGKDPGGNTINLLTNFGISSKTLNQGTSLGYYQITAITVSSGSVVMYRK